MKRWWLPVFLVSLVLLSVFLSRNLVGVSGQQNSPDVYFGVYVAYGGTSEALAAVEKYHDFTNLIAFGTYASTSNASMLNQTLQYAYDHGMYFMSFPSSYFANMTRPDWYAYANRTWGNRQLGFFWVADEPGGRQLDLAERVDNASGDIGSYSEAATAFVNSLSVDATRVKTRSLNGTNLPLFTCDYGLYWYDYKAGFDGLFSEFGWNYSRHLNAALVRGSATMQNREWGVIILWTYDVPPYIESGQALYDDLVLAYDEGAKYILIFDTNKEYDQDILQQEHVQAMQQFWQYVQANPRNSYAQNERVAYVLPQDYGFGFRGPNDKIWGLQADMLSWNISVGTNQLLNEYGYRLDIIYDGGLEPGNNYGYSQLFHWDEPELQPTPEPPPFPPRPSPFPTPSASPTPSPIPSPSPSPSASPSPSSSPSSTSSPTPTLSPSPLPTEEPIPTPETNSPTLSPEYVFAVAVTGAAVTVVVLAALVSLKKRS